MLRIFLVIDDYNELIYLQSLLKKLGFDVEGLQNQKKYADVSLGFNPQVLITTAKGQKVDGMALARSITKRRGLPKIMALRTPSTGLTGPEFEKAGIDSVLDSPINPKKLLLALAELGGLDDTALIEKYNKIKSSVVTEADAQAIVVHDDGGNGPNDIQRVKEALEQAARERQEGPGFQVKDENAGEPAGGAATRFPLDGHGTVGGKIEENSTTEIEDAVDKIVAANAAERKKRFDEVLKEMGTLPESHFDRDRISDFNKKIRANGSTDDIGEIEDERREFVKALFKNQKR